jgi:hypothetical protein
MLKYYDLFRTSAMHLSNVWRRFRLATIYAFGIFALLYCAYQLYSAVTDGAMKGRNGDWVTFQSNPAYYVFLLIINGFIVAIVIATVGAMIVGWQNERKIILRNRSKPVFDDAIRLDPDSR